MKPRFQMLVVATTALLASSCLNPFAPRLDNSPAGASSDPTTVDGFFRRFQQAYATRDTTLYGDLIDGGFIFVYNDWEEGGIEKTWGRDKEMSTTYGLFQTAQRLDLIWNNIISTSTDSTRLNVYRGFNLTVVQPDRH
jgi:hypothetical protein